MIFFKHKHKWKYYKNSHHGPCMYYRACKCGQLEEFRDNVPVFGPDWYALVSYTQSGGDDLLQRLAKLCPTK